MYGLTSDWVWNFNSQKYLVYTINNYREPKFGSASLYRQPFSRYNVKTRKRLKCTEWPQTECEHLTVKIAGIH